MADAPASAPGALPGETPAQEKARLRRERRAQKIADGGASRLQAISAVQGNSSFRDLAQDAVKPSTASRTQTPDPDEVDISLAPHHYSPSPQPRVLSPFAFPRDAAPPLPPGHAPDPSQDPMAAMLQQMMAGGAGGMPGRPGLGAQPGDVPPGLANLLSAMQGGSAPEPSPDQSSAWLWRLVHSLLSLALAIYIVLQTPFTGSKLARDASPTDQDWAVDSSTPETLQHFFYLFATFEVVLQSSRYFIEKGQLQGSGMLSSIGQMLPEPYAGYVRVVGRYSVIYSTVVSDAMVVVFVLGAASWWRGGAVA